MGTARADPDRPLDALNHRSHPYHSGQHKLNSLIRTIAGLIVGGTLILGAGVACTADAQQPLTIENYIGEMRHTVPAEESVYMADDQLVAAGQALCAYPESLAAAKGAAGAYQANVAVMEKYCPILNSAPNAMQSFPGTDAGGPIESAAPQQVALDQRFDIYDGNGTKMADAAITKIDVDADCSESKKYLSKQSTPERGHFVIVSMDIATTPEFISDNFGSIMDADFSLTGPDGYVQDVTGTGTGYCLPQDDVFGLMDPSSKYRGEVLLDMKDTTGTLTFRPRFNRDWPGVTIAMP